MSDARTTPREIDIVRDTAVTITFEDGAVCAFPVDELRAVCPCASCRGWRERGEQAWPRPATSTDISIVHAELSGAWGLSIDWSDGHSTGIYAWSVLRRWWDDGRQGGLTIDLAPGTVGQGEHGGGAQAEPGHRQ